MKFKGIIPPVASIFHADETLNEKGMANIIDAVIKGGVDGLFFLGSAGEVAHMTPALRQQTMEFAIAHTNKRLPTLIGAIACGTQETIAYAKAAEKAGADGVVLLNPYYAAMTDEALYKHFATIAESISIPSILYNLPGTTGQSLSVDVVKKLALNIPSIHGLKDTVDTISHIRAMITAIKPERPDFAIFCGFDEYLATTLLIGGDGCVPASANFAPHLTCGIYKAYQKKDWDTIEKLQRMLSHVPPLYSMGPPFYAAMKEAIKLAGIDITTDVLRPALPVDSATKEAVSAMMKKIDPKLLK